MKNNNRCIVSEEQDEEEVVVGQEGGGARNRITSWILLKGRKTDSIHSNTYSYTIYNPYYYYYIHTIFCVFGYR